MKIQSGKFSNLISAHIFYENCTKTGGHGYIDSSSDTDHVCTF